MKVLINPEWSPQERARARLLGILSIAIDPKVGDGEKYRIEALAKSMSLGFDPKYVCDLLNIAESDYEKYVKDLYFQERLSHYHAEAKKSPEKAAELAKAISFETMGEVAYTVHTSSDPSSILAAAEKIFRAAKVTQDDKPKIELNLSQQEINVLVGELKEVKKRHLTDGTD